MEARVPRQATQRKPASNTEELGRQRAGHSLPREEHRRGAEVGIALTDGDGKSTAPRVAHFRA